MKLRIVLLALGVLFICACTQKKSDKNTIPKETEKDSIITKKADSIEINADTTEIDSIQNKETVNDTQSFESISDIFDACKKPAQKFTINPQTDTTIICKEGTKIIFHSNSLVYEKSGLKVEQDVKISITEYYKTSDIILANLSTTSDGKLLETGGMINIEAYTNNKKLKLDKSEVIEIIFPNRKKDDQMQLFNGELTSSGINWIIDIDEPTYKDDIYHVVDKQPEFPGGINELYRFLNKKIKYPLSAKESGIQGRVVCQFIINQDGSIDDIVVIKSVDPDLDLEAIRVIKTMPKWKPGKINGETVRVKYTLPILFRITSSTYNEEYKESFEKTYSEKNISESKISEISTYILSSSRLGWVNCDRFRTFPLTNLEVDIKSTSKTIMYLVFNRFQAIIYGQNNDGIFTFNNIPVNEDANILAIKNENNKIFLAIKKTKILKQKESNLTFKRVSIGELKRIIERLNK